MSPRRVFAIAALAFAAGGCAANTAYRPAAVATPERYAAAGSASAEEASLDAWWRGFGDARLDRLVEAALAASPDIETARSRLREARQQEIVAGARGLPQVNAEASASRTHISENAIPLPPGAAGGPGGAGAFGLPGSTFSQFKLGFDASWELDLFGAARAGLDAARARTGAARWTQRDVQVSLAAEIARAYLDLRAAQARATIARAEADRQDQVLALVRARAGAGFVSHLDVERQASLASSSSAAIAPLEAQAMERIHALGVLTGQPPEALIAQLRAPAELPAAPPPPPGLPSQLLLRRPDLRAAGRQVAATAGDLGVATAELYPRITLTAAPSLVSTSLASLLDGDSAGYNLGAGLLWPVFDAGRLKARRAVAGERQTQALAAYRKAVLTALKDVEDALVRYQADTARRAELETAVSAGGRAVALAVDRRRAGIVDQSEALDAQGQANRARDELVQARAAQAQDVVALFKALGGGWSDTDLREARR